MENLHTYGQSGRSHLMVPIGKDRRMQNDEPKLTHEIANLRKNLEETIHVNYKKFDVSILAKSCMLIIRLDWPDWSRWAFQCLDFPNIVKQNEKLCCDTRKIEQLQDALKALLKYGLNLLNPASSNWRLISFENSVYLTKVAILEGHKDILSSYGYTKHLPYGQSYPDGSQQPNFDTVTKVMGDLAVAYFEVDCYKTGNHPHRTRIHRFINSGEKTKIPPTVGQSKHSEPQTAARISDLSSGYGSCDSINVKEQSASHFKKEPFQQQTEKCLTVSQGDHLTNTISSDATSQKYEHDFSQNEQWITPPSSPPKQMSVLHLPICGLCKKNPANMQCTMCSQPRCERCDELWHKHPSRRSHSRHKVAATPPTPVEPVVPVIVAAASTQSTIESNSFGASTASSVVEAEASKIATLNDVSKTLTLTSGQNSESPHVVEREAVCDFCEKPGTTFCLECKVAYCHDCDAKRHSSGKRIGHQRKDIVEREKITPSADLSTVSYISSEEDIDVRAPPSDKYAAPPAVLPPLPDVETLGSWTPGAQGHLAGTEAAGKQTSVENEMSEIVQEDIHTMEKVNSIRDMKRVELDPVRKEQLGKEETTLWQRHLQLKEKLAELEKQLAGKQRQPHKTESDQVKLGPEASPCNTTQVHKIEAIPQSSASPQQPVANSSQGLLPSVVYNANGQPTNRFVVSRATVAAPLPSPRLRGPSPPLPDRRGSPSSRLDVNEPPAEGWTCDHCTFRNPDMSTNICSVCDKTTRRRAVKLPSVKQKQPLIETAVKLSSSSQGGDERQPTLVSPKRRKSEYYQQLEAENLALKQQAKQKYEEKLSNAPGEITPRDINSSQVGVSDRDILKLAQIIPDWESKKLGINLGFTLAELERIEMGNDIGSRKDKIYEMLQRWKCKTHPVRQRNALMEALKAAGLSVLGDVLEDMPPVPGSSNPKGRGTISDEELMHLSKTISRDKVPELGLYLGLGEAQILSYVNGREGTLQMLLNWKRKSCDSADQRSELTRALHMLGHDGLTAECAERKADGVKPPRTAPPPISMVMEPIGDRELRKVAAQLDEDEIPALGLYLGFSHSAITVYQRTQRREPHGAVTKMLEAWRERQPLRSQRNVLASALEQLGCQHLADQIFVGSLVKSPGMQNSPDDSPRMTHATSFSDLSFAHDEDKRRYEEMRIESLRLVSKLREGEAHGISPGKVKCALNLRGDESIDPLEWIERHWPDEEKAVAQRASQELREILELDIDAKIMEHVQVSCALAGQCLVSCDGNRDESVKEAIKITQNKVLEIVELQCHSTEDIVRALEQEDVAGDIERALDALQTTKMAEYADRVWVVPADDNEYFQQVIRNDERSIRMLMVEYRMRSWGRANTAAKLIEMNEFSVEDVVLAAEECGDMKRSEEFLRQECSMCFADFPRNKLMSLINCQCMMCRPCVIQHFEIIARDQSIMKGKCPNCAEPDLDNPAVAADYFQFLDILLREILNEDVYGLFQRKLRDWNLMQDRDFCWCAHCNSGFINGAPDRRKMRCPECNKLTCFHCKKQWLDQHEGISCEQFQQWKENNDPDLQAQGLAAHLNENGIECPRCKMRYELAKGGCMHFKCPQCTFEFCCGCNQPMKKGEVCGKFPSCATKGLHTHHPRDCLYYLRDLDIQFLQDLLEDAVMRYNKDPPEGADVNQDGECGVKEQKDGPHGLVDEKCGRTVSPGNAGLCRIHYKEYLVSLINSVPLDPARKYPIQELEIILQREEIPIPVRHQNEPDRNYRIRLYELLRNKLPLTKEPRQRPR